MRTDWLLSERSWCSLDEQRRSAQVGRSRAVGLRIVAAMGFVAIALMEMPRAHAEQELPMTPADRACYERAEQLDGPERSSALGTCLQIQRGLRSPTVWKALRKSFSDLLNEGWQIASHAETNFVARAGPAGATISQLFSFVLQKDRKFVWCNLQDPEAAWITTSSCFALN